MADRVAEVRRIAIDRRHVTPRLTGAAYAAAVRKARPPAAFRAEAGTRVEGFLFPALYQFEEQTSAETLVANQLAAFAERWRTVDLRPARRQGRTPYEVLTVASMVERETVAPEERRLVAAVIYNRLDLDMPLGIDATLRYGLGIPGTRPLTKAHLASNSPYNTRRFRGLPPTPIGTRAWHPSAPPPTLPASTTCTTFGNRTRSTTSSPPTTKSSAGRPRVRLQLLGRRRPSHALNGRHVVEPSLSTPAARVSGIRRRWRRPWTTSLVCAVFGNVT